MSWHMEESLMLWHFTHFANCLLFFRSCAKSKRAVNKSAKAAVGNGTEWEKKSATGEMPRKVILPNFAIEIFDFST